jgi:N-acetylmuramoyl-L-alanine amidase
MDFWVLYDFEIERQSMNIEQFISPNQNERAHRQKPSLVILHYTGTQTMIEAHDIYMTIGKVSPHYMIDKDGSVRSYVDEEKRAWHAGKSFWKGDNDINSSSIGIEIVNSGHEYALEEFPTVQIESLIKVLHGITDRWNIKPQSILGHSDIAIGRKIDPGERFPWEALKAENIGLLPQDCDVVFKYTADTLFTKIGYDPDVNLELRAREFRRHYLRHSDLDAGVNNELLQALSSILHQSQ